MIWLMCDFLQDPFSRGVDPFSRERRGEKGKYARL